MKISKYISFEEATKSATATRMGIDNSPSEDQLNNMKYVASEVFDKVREYVNGPLAATSFFRSEKLNNAVGGSSKTSQHMSGQAIDIDCDVFGYGNNNQVFDFISKNLEYDQLIGEYPDSSGKFSWVHVSLVKGGHNRKQRLVKLKSEYIQFNSWELGQQ